MPLEKRALLVDIVLLAIVWQLAAGVLQLSFLPSPLTVLINFATGLPSGMGRHLVVSAARVILSLALAVLIATPLAILAGQSKLLNRFLAPLVYFLYPIPKIVFLPLILLFLGLGNASKVALLVFIISFQVFVIVHDAASRVRPEILASVRSLGATRWHLLRYVYFPTSIPAVLTSLRVSAGTAMAVLFIAESFATTTGLGYYIMVETWGRGAYAQMYAGVLTMSLLGFVLYALIEQIERRLCRWTRGTERQQSRTVMQSSTSPQASSWG